GALKKNGDAHAGAGGGGVGERFVPSEREEGVPGGRGEPLERTVPQRAPEAGCTVRSAEGVGCGAGGLGYKRLHVLLRREGWRVNHKLVYRLYREERLALKRRRPKRRKSAAPREVRPLVS